ncbi:MAG: flagellar FliJ family protein, partial [bacterium]
AQTEELRKRELAQARFERDMALMALGRAERSLTGLLKEQSETRDKSVDLAEEAWFQARLNALGMALRQAGLDLKVKEQEWEARRLKAVEASRERLVLERLEEHQHQDYLFQLNQEEQGLLDDLAQRSLSQLAFPR